MNQLETSRYNNIYKLYVKGLDRYGDPKVCLIAKRLLKIWYKKKEPLPITIQQGDNDTIVFTRIPTNRHKEYYRVYGNSTVVVTIIDYLSKNRNHVIQRKFVVNMSAIKKEAKNERANKRSPRNNRGS